MIFGPQAWCALSMIQGPPDPSLWRPTGATRSVKNVVDYRASPYLVDSEGQPPLTSYSSLHIEGNAQDGPLRVQIVKLPWRGASHYKQLIGGRRFQTNRLGSEQSGERIRRTLDAGETTIRDTDMADPTTAKGMLANVRMSDFFQGIWTSNIAGRSFNY